MVKVKYLKNSDKWIILEKRAKQGIYLDGFLKRALDNAKKRVKDENWDYVSIISGSCGVGKSTFARTLAYYCCPNFNEKYIAFTDEEFIRITNEAPPFSSVILDESFQSLNARVTMSASFLRIINHLQIIRQKHLFIFLCLPNFFDLSKNVAIFRASHLFVVYADEQGKRGRFLAFSRDNKRRLFIKGGKYLDYDCVRGNFKGRFKQEGIIDEKLYDNMKLKHLKAQQEVLEEKKKKKSLDKIDIVERMTKMGFSGKKQAEILGVTPQNISQLKQKSQKLSKINTLNRI